MLRQSDPCFQMGNAIGRRAWIRYQTKHQSNRLLGAWVHPLTTQAQCRPRSAYEGQMLRNSPWTCRQAQILSTDWMASNRLAEMLHKPLSTLPPNQCKFARNRLPWTKWELECPKTASDSSSNHSGFPTTFQTVHYLYWPASTGWCHSALAYAASQPWNARTSCPEGSTARAYLFASNADNCARISLPKRPGFAPSIRWQSQHPLSVLELRSLHSTPALQIAPRMARRLLGNGLACPPTVLHDQIHRPPAAEEHPRRKPLGHHPLQKSVPCVQFPFHLRLSQNPLG